MHIPSLQDYFTPDESILTSLPKEKLALIQATYTTIGNIICAILKEQYGTGNLDICMTPVNRSRVMMRISEQRTKEISFTDSFNSGISYFIKDIILAREDDEIFVAKDQKGLDVLSYCSEDMIALLERFTSGFPNAQKYKNAISGASLSQERFKSSIPASKLN